MKKGYRIFTVLFVVSILVITGGSAMAAWTSDSATKNVIIGAGASQTAAVSTTSSPVYSLGDAESMAVGSFVTFTLTGGAVWASQIGSSAVTLSPQVDGGTLSYLSGGAAGTVSVKFRTGIFTISTPSTITFNSKASNNLINVSKLGAGSNVDMLISIDDSSGGSIISNKSLYAMTGGGRYLFTGVNLFSVTNTPSYDTADVAASSGAYTKFEGNALAGTGGNVLTIAPPTSYDIPSVGPTGKKVLVTLVGDFKGISKIVTKTNFTGSDSTGSTTGGVAGAFLINTAMTEAYAVNNETYFPATTQALAPTFHIDGSTVQVQRVVYAKVENLEDGVNYVAGTWSPSSKCYEIKRNGVFAAFNSLGPYNTIKISDTNGKIPAGGARVYFAAWDSAGVRLAEAPGLADASALSELIVQANQTITLTGDQIAARFVGSPMKYEVAIQSTSALISNIKKTPEGFGSTVYTPPTSGGAL